MMKSEYYLHDVKCQYRYYLHDEVRVWGSKKKEKKCVLCVSVKSTRTRGWALYVYLDRGVCMPVKKSSEIFIKLVCLEGGLERGRRIKVVCVTFRQTVPHSQARVRKCSFTKCFCVYMRGVDHN